MVQYLWFDLVVAVQENKRDGQAPTNPSDVSYLTTKKKVKTYPNKNFINCRRKWMDEWLHLQLKWLIGLAVKRRRPKTRLKREKRVIYTYTYSRINSTLMNQPPPYPVPSYYQVT